MSSFESEPVKSDPVPVLATAAATEIEEVKEDTKVEEVVDQFKLLATAEGLNERERDRVRAVQSEKSHLKADFTFESPELLLPDYLRRALMLKMGFEAPSAIQAATMPLIMQQKNIIAQAQSGSGKTVAFTCGMLNRIDVSLNKVQAVCLSPTRELAGQIYRDAVVPLSSYLEGVVIETALGGMKVERGSRSNAHIVVGTPGTVIKNIKQHYYDFSAVKIFVLDEADAMVVNSPQGRGHRASTLEIKDACPTSAQILFFSATFTEEVLKFSKTIVPKAYQITLPNTESLVLKVIKQYTINTKDVEGGKLKVLQDIYMGMSLNQSIVFCDMREEANKLSRMMNETGFTVSTLHGELEHDERDRVLDEFRAGKSKVLITTNALARGVDIPGVALVVNYDLPTTRKGPKKVADPATYIHRIGRTGRYGRPGTSINFLHSAEDEDIMNKIEEFYCSNGGKMTTSWSADDITGLAEEHNERTSGN